MDKIETIRQRKGYIRWDNLQRDISLCTTVEQIMSAIHKMVDNMNGYGSHRAADLSNESLQQVVEDCNLNKVTVKFTDHIPDTAKLDEEHDV